MKKSRLKENAFENFGSGLNCAESVFLSGLKNLESELDPGLVKVASGFGGGVGGTREEICGVLTGGIMAFGLLFGRTSPTEEDAKAKEMATALLARFIQRYGTTQCQGVINQFDEATRSTQCQELTMWVAEIVADILEGQSQ